MINAVTVEIDALGAKTSELLGVLLGSGASSGDVQKALTVEAGQCAWKIAEELGPSSKAEGAKKVEKDAKGHLNSGEGKFTVFQKYTQHHGAGNMYWLTAGPNFLLGIDINDWKPSLSVSGALELYYEGRKKGSRGKAYEDLGKRGNQHVMWLNRVRVSGRTFDGVIKAISEKLGQSKAAWARTAQEFLPSKRIPSWVLQKIPNVVANGKSVLTNGTESAVNPFVEFGSRAAGVSSNAVVQDKIRGGLVKSQYALSAKIAKVILGHTYNWNTGQVFKPTQFDEN